MEITNIRQRQTRNRTDYSELFEKDIGTLDNKMEDSFNRN